MPKKNQEECLPAGRQGTMELWNTGLEKKFGFSYMIPSFHYSIIPEFSFFLKFV